MLLFYILPYLNLKEILSLKKISKELSKFVNYIPEEVIFPLAWNYIYKIMEEITCAGKNNVHAPAGALGWISLHRYVARENPGSLNDYIAERKDRHIKEAHQRRLTQRYPELKLTPIEYKHANKPQQVLHNLLSALQESKHFLLSSKKIREEKYPALDEIRRNYNVMSSNVNNHPDVYVEIYHKLEKMSHAPVVDALLAAIFTLVCFFGGMAGFLDNDWIASLVRSWLIISTEFFYLHNTYTLTETVYDLQDTKIIQNFINKTNSFLQFFESNENRVESPQFSSSLEEQKQIPIVITVNESKDNILDEKKSLLYSPRRFITLFSSSNERPFEDKENDLEIEYSQLSQMKTKMILKPHYCLQTILIKNSISLSNELANPV